jgi:hypothetical protein
MPDHDGDRRNLFDAQRENRRWREAIFLSRAVDLRPTVAIKSRSATGLVGQKPQPSHNALNPWTEICHPFGTTRSDSVAENGSVSFQPKGDRHESSQSSIYGAAWLC